MTSERYRTLNYQFTRLGLAEGEFMPHIDELTLQVLGYSIYGMLFKHIIETGVMKINTQQEIMKSESKDEFKPGATVAVLALLLAFIASSVYILISGYLSIA